jgi:molybdopterin-guanine dinucleotide biosynthesis protein A
MIDEPVALVVNAGGASRRMGRAKSLLPMPPDETPLIIQIVRRLAPLVTDRVVIVSNDPAVVATTKLLANVQVVPDQWSDGGALGGVATGLADCAGWAMVVACDMPLVSATIFAQLVAVASSQPTLDAVIPRIGGQAQPFHGLWHRRVLPTLEAQLRVGEVGVQVALARLKVAWMDEAALGIDADDLAFYNINTPQEWEELLAILADQTRRIA